MPICDLDTPPFHVLTDIQWKRRASTTVLELNDMPPYFGAAGITR
jgi:hypothetical protein